ncbi:MAG: hypothetical protein K5657_03545 [Desulfovibrio sp.]|nr:hypothetical protein [Desulfovibrio sp.]
MVELHTKINNFLAQSNSIKKDLLREIQQEMKKRGFPTAVDEENGVLRFADSILFQSGEYQLSEKGTAVLKELAEVLQSRLPGFVWQRKGDTFFCPRKACLEAVYVEGHTDKRPVQGNLKGGIRSNFELSSARALSTYKILASHEALNGFVNGRGEKLLGVCGYGESRPIRPGDNEDDLSANRRIDLRFLMEAPRLDTLGDLE